MCKNCKSASKETQSIYRIKSIRLAYSAVEYDGTAKKPAVEVKTQRAERLPQEITAFHIQITRISARPKLSSNSRVTMKGRRHSHLTSRWV